MNNVIEAENLAKSFEELQAVRDVSLCVEEGEILALLGPNGAGKTTTIRILSSIIAPTKGRAMIAGYDVVRQGRQVRRVTGHLTEMPGLYDRMSACDYLDFFGELYGMPQPLRRARSSNLLDEFGLGEAAGRRLGEFSKGMRQKVALIREMLHSPRVLFLDEPTSALDPEGAKQVRDAILKLRREGQTVLLSSHNLFEAELLADRIAIIRRGEILAQGSPDELKRQYLGDPIMELALALPLGGPWPEIDGLTPIEQREGTYFKYCTAQPEKTNPLLLSRLAAMGAQVVTLSAAERSLEQVYLKLMQEAVAI